MSSTNRLAPRLVLVIISITMGLWMLHSIFIYYKLMQMKTPSLQGRYSRIVISIIILGASYFIIYFPFTILAATNGVPEKAYSIIFTILTQLTALIYPFLIVYRSWMVHFKIQWNIAMEDTKWSIFIDQNATKNNWYLKHHQMNKKYASKILFVIWCLFSFPAILFSFLGETYSIYVSGLYGIQYFVPILTLAVLLCKIPKYDDIFMINKEIKMIIIASLITTILYVPALILPAIIPIWGSNILHLYVLIGPFCILYPHLYFPFNKFNLPKTYCSLQNYTSTTKTSNYVATTETNTKSQKRYTLQDCIQNEDGFLVFTRHINKEFAIENMLFCVSIYQFKRKLKELFGEYNISMDANDIFETIVFPENKMPKSTLIAAMNMENVKQCVTELFMKYIVENGYFAVNISFETRSVLNQRVSDLNINGINENDAFHLFDDAIKEIYCLLQGSFSRFKKSNQYQRLMSISLKIIAE